MPYLELNDSSGKSAKELLRSPPNSPLDYSSCSLHSQGLRDMAGITKFKNLKEINLSCNSIMSMESLSELTNLRSIIMSYNQV